MRLLHNLRNRLPANTETGQILVLSALVMTVLLVFSAMAIDIGFWVHTRTKLQADADAMALAGAQKLCAEVTCRCRRRHPRNKLRVVERPQEHRGAIGSRRHGMRWQNQHQPRHDHGAERNATFLPSSPRSLASSAPISTPCATARKAAIAGGTGHRALRHRRAPAWAYGEFGAVL